MRFVGFSALAMTAFLSASSFSVIPEPADAAIICPDIFMPVCAVKHGVRNTYPNACNARRVRARILHAGACVAPSGKYLLRPVHAGLRRQSPYPQAADLRKSLPG